MRFNKYLETDSLSTNTFKPENCLCSDPKYSAKQEELFNRAEQWLNNIGIETRTEYGNVLPTYNLFLKIGEYLERRVMEGNNE